MQKENYPLLYPLHPAYCVDGISSNRWSSRNYFLPCSSRWAFVSSAVNYVAPSHVGMVCSLLVTSSLVMLSRFPVMARGVRQMF